MTQQLRASSENLVGRVLLGRYRVVRELAKGGMGVVYLARAEGAVGFVKPVVIKLLLPELAQDERIVGMFVREAQILAQLRHPSLVDVLEFGEQEGFYALVLEYVRGHHLGQWLKYLQLKKRTAPPEILIQVVTDVLDALHHAHNQMHPDGSPMQIVHRDVSPSNILLDETGRARLLDFGVARMRGGAGYKTQVNGFMGKLSYTAPELFAGQDASPRSDLYACGVVLHEALLGHNVFRAELQAATLSKVMSLVPESIELARPGVPKHLDEVLSKALMKNPDARHADAHEFAVALRKLQTSPESELRTRLATMLASDFGTEMADLLNLESLVHRDEAWRRLSKAPPPRHEPANQQTVTRPARNMEPRQPEPVDANLPAAPTAIGATVVRSPTGRMARGGQALAEPPTVVAPIPAAQPVAAERPITERSAPWAAREPVPPTAARSHASQRGMMVALAAVGCLALVAIGLSLRPAPVPQPSAPPPIRVVTEPAPVTTAPPPTAAAEPAKPVATQALPKPEDKPKRPPRAADSQGLTQALRKQQPKLQACFKQHSVSLEGQPTTQLDFDLDASGKLTRVELLPRELAATSLGQCLLSVARTTSFPVQQRKVSFSIPLTARRAPGG
jgi:serine/threonine protein kinase